MVPIQTIVILLAMRLRVVVPHFFREGNSDNDGGYGSGRRGNRLPRSLSLARCLGSVLALNRAPRDWILNLAERQLELTSTSTAAGLQALQVEMHVFVNGDDWLQDVLEVYAQRLHLHRMDLEDPRQLPLTAVRNLIDMDSPADLSMYLEDDLVIQDSRYADKMSWFLERTNHRYALMPHRYEPTVANAPQRLCVDGPIKSVDQIQPVWASDEAIVASGRFWDGQEVSFCAASNPHSGSFCVSDIQLEQLRKAEWTPVSFVGPLETAATGSIMNNFPILKPSWACREFLMLEHGNPSFLGLMGEFQPRKV